MKKLSCHHTLGYIEQDTYNGSVVDFVSLPLSDLETATKLKSSDGTLYKFCPHCGKNLDSLLDKEIEKMMIALQERQEAERVDKKKKEEAFQEKVNAVAKNTKLDQLPEEGSFMVLFHPTAHSYNKNVLITGPKNHILRNCVHHNTNKSTPDILIVTNIYQVLSPEELTMILEKEQWTTIETKPSCQKFEKTVGNKKTELYPEYGSGKIYITYYTTDSDGDVSKSYGDFYQVSLSEYLKTPVELKEIILE